MEFDDWDFDIFRNKEHQFQQDHRSYAKRTRLESNVGREIFILIRKNDKSLQLAILHLIEIAEVYDLNAFYDSDCNVLHRCIMDLDLVIFQALIEKGVDLNIPSYGGFTPVMMIVESPGIQPKTKMRMIKMLHFAGADIHKMVRQQNAFSLAVSKNGNLNFAARDQRHYADFYDSMTLIRYFVYHDANINQIYFGNRTILFFITRWEREHRWYMFNFFREKGIDLFHKDMFGRPFASYISSFDIRLFKALLKEGWDFHEDYKSGQTFISDNSEASLADGGDTRLKVNYFLALKLKVHQQKEIFDSRGEVID